MESKAIAEDLARELEDLTGDAMDNYVNESLEIVILYRQSLGNQSSPAPSGVELLVSYGGPSTRVISRIGSDYLTIKMNWWDDTYETTSYAPEVAAYLNELAECYEVGL